jgi:hypothetical protein
MHLCSDVANRRTAASLCSCVVLSYVLDEFSFFTTNHEYIFKPVTAVLVAPNNQAEVDYIYARSCSLKIMYIGRAPAEYIITCTVKLPILRN